MHDILKIGTLIYVVHKSYSKKKYGAKVIPCRIRGYENIGGSIVPLVKAVGMRTEVNMQMHNIYTDLTKAVNAIKSEKA